MARTQRPAELNASSIGTPWSVPRSSLSWRSSPADVDPVTAKSAVRARQGPGIGGLPALGAELAQEAAVVRPHPLFKQAALVVDVEDVDQVEHDALAVRCYRTGR